MTLSHSGRFRSVDAYIESQWCGRGPCYGVKPNSEVVEQSRNKGNKLQWDVLTSSIFVSHKLRVSLCKTHSAPHGLCHFVHYDSHTNTHLQAVHPLSWTPGPPAVPPLDTGRSLSGRPRQTGWTSAYRYTRLEWCGWIGWWGFTLIYIHGIFNYTQSPMWPPI